MKQKRRSLWCSKCAMYVKAQKFYTSRTKIGKQNVPKRGLYLCQVCGKLIRDN